MILPRYGFIASLHPGLTMYIKDFAERKVWSLCMYLYVLDIWCGFIILFVHIQCLPKRWREGVVCSDVLCV